MSARGRLRSIIEAARAERGLSLKALTVLAPQRDPFRLDTPARHRDSQWLAEQLQRLDVGQRSLSEDGGLERGTVHLRGLHYMLVSAAAVKPDGLPYTNTEADWIWLSEIAAKAARWLGYVDFELIVDARNTPPAITRFEEPHPWPLLYAGIEVEIPEADDLEPRMDVDGFVGVQPYKLVLYGEKTSLGNVLDDVAYLRRADLYLPAGEISDTQLYEMAQVGHDDARPMVVFCFSDCDPSGWQMPISIGRKLQALKELQFYALDFQVYRVALTPDHVRDYHLPSTPLKATEKRASAWTAATGVEQTEIDALAALQPDLLRRIALDAIAPFFDTSLERRVREARQAWLQEAQARLEEQLDQEALARIRDEAAEKLTELRSEIDALNEALKIDVSDFDLPETVVPGPELDEAAHGKPLIDSDWDWAEQTLRLVEDKKYADDADEEPS